MGNPDIFTISDEGSFKRSDEQISPTSLTGILKGIPPTFNGKINTNPNGKTAVENGRLNGLEGHGARRVRHSIVSMASTVPSDFGVEPSLLKSFRSSLLDKNIDTIMCTSHSFRSSFLDKNVLRCS
ncbi:hypothetical protein Btru_044950 [Bulinus truncatus]|nr:hypothetical protein Btru_044950 [Bulinus truncatus]